MQKTFRTIAICVLVALLLLLTCACGPKKPPANDNTPESNTPPNQPDNPEKDNTQKVEFMYISVNGAKLTVQLAENTATEALVEKLKQGKLTLELHDYGSFEKTGPLGFSLPKSDVQMDVDCFDVVLYLGSNICIYYAPNSWSFTALGKIQGVTKSQLKSILGNGNVTVTLSLD